MDITKMRARRINHVLEMVTKRVPKDKANLLTKEENYLYDRTEKQAEEHFKKWGEYPIFELVEIESDDECLDIYHD